MSTYSKDLLEEEVHVVINDPWGVLPAIGDLTLGHRCPFFVRIQKVHLCVQRILDQREPGRG